jgi:hypothetical protein
VHYCWVRPFEEFYVDELKARLRAPAENAVIIFDCWTPHSMRGHSYYGIAIRQLSENLSRAGKVPWIFSAVKNISSVKAIEKTAFQKRFTMIRDKVFLWQGLRKLPIAPGAASQAVASS